MARPETRTAKEIEPVKLSDTKIGTLTADKLREELTRGKIRIPDNSLKPNLQALYALWKLCLLFPEEIPDHEMLATVARWCSMSTAKLLTTIAKQSLKSSGTKWDNVEVLIEHGYRTRNRNEEEATDESREEEGEREEEQEDEETVPGANEEEVTAKAKSVRKGKEKASSRANTSQAADQDRQLPTSDALSLFLTMLHGHLGRTQTAPLLRNSPITSPQSLLSLLKKLPRLDTTEEIARAFDDNVSKTTAQVLSAIHNLYADMIIIAPADLRVKGFPEEILQFVVARPTDELRVNFDGEGGDTRNTDVYFHGTSIGSLHSILFDGFEPPSKDLLWLAKQPGHSGSFAFKPTSIAPDFQWNAVPFSNRGVLLGCEVVNVAGSPNIHVTQSFASAIVRYIFLLPPHKYFYGIPSPGPTLPERAQILRAMKAGLKKIRALGTN